MFSRILNTEMDEVFMDTCVKGEKRKSALCSTEKKSCRDSKENLGVEFLSRFKKIRQIVVEV